ncbi:hypothetical protein DVQ33_05650 [Yersinia enterocolitica]|nr:hypothetical protein [Yersinia enterocolitica]EKN5071357.1 hypothetical protein [Yersinia enterocolitica]EKN5077033.1 hypothetical protein [Yersinia enterocolitica]EKN5143112.1 hypothetical protein [Yersinia enterocolitica]EKN5909553.1 hypothetical protein [Yersinia enterocolitica]
MRGLHDGFFSLLPNGGRWREIIADVTYYYSWGPGDAWSLTYSNLIWWCQQAERINNIKAGKNG